MLFRTVCCEGTHTLLMDSMVTQQPGWTNTEFESISRFTVGGFLFLAQRIPAYFSMCRDTGGSCLRCSGWMESGINTVDVSNHCTVMQISMTFYDLKKNPAVAIGCPLSSEISLLNLEA